MAKGFDFERWISVTLSEWWTDGERDDIFWRSTTSGARATSRHKKGKRTAGSTGDIAAIDPVGYPLMELVLLEAKRGYNHDSIHDAFDGMALQQFEKWYAKIRKGQEINQAPYWLLIWKRDRKNPMIWMPQDFFNALRAEGCQLHDTIPQMRLTLQMEVEHTTELIGIFGTLLENFLDEVLPADILAIYEEEFARKPTHTL